MEHASLPVPEQQPLELYESFMEAISEGRFKDASSIRPHLAPEDHRIADSEFGIAVSVHTLLVNGERAEARAFIGQSIYETVASSLRRLLQSSPKTQPSREALGFKGASLPRPVEPLPSSKSLPPKSLVEQLIQHVERVPEADGKVAPGILRQLGNLLVPQGPEPAFLGNMQEAHLLGILLQAVADGKQTLTLKSVADAVWIKAGPAKQHAKKFKSMLREKGIDLTIAGDKLKLVPMETSSK